MSKEIQQIINKLKTFSGGEKAILATVIDLQGSGYRLPGAKMLIAENGDAFGTVSGGCLESDVLERAQKVLETGEAEIFTYDTTGQADSVFSLNMGCNGVVSILIEPIGAETILFKSWQAAVEQRKRRTIATLVSTDQNFPVGGRIFCGAGGQFEFENLPEFFEDFQELIEHCSRFFDSNEPTETVGFSNEKGRFEFFFENINPPLNLMIFGAGYDAVPLADFAKSLGWRVSVIDHRAAFATKERFPNGDEIIVTHPEHLPENLTFDKDSVAVLMTHNYEKDREIMRFLLKYDLPYIGALGPKRRTERLLGELAAEDSGFDSSNLKNIHAPVGLDIGADTPEAIALSIAAEIKSVLTKRNGGFLRERQGSIYGRPERRGDGETRRQGDKETRRQGK